MPDLASQLLDALAPSAPGTGLLWAVVAATSPLTVTFPGDTAAVPVSHLAAYSAPAVGDRVAVARCGQALLVLGRIA